MISTLKNQHTEKDEPTLPQKYFELEILHACMVYNVHYWPSGIRIQPLIGWLQHWKIFLILFTLSSKHVIWPNQLAPEILATKWPNCGSAKKILSRRLFHESIAVFYQTFPTLKIWGEWTKITKTKLVFSFISSLYSSLSCFILFSFLVLAAGFSNKTSRYSWLVAVG